MQKSPKSSVDILVCACVCVCVSSVKQRISNHELKLWTIHQETESRAPTRVGVLAVLKSLHKTPKANYLQSWGLRVTHPDQITAVCGCVCVCLSVCVCVCDSTQKQMSLTSYCKCFQLTKDLTTHPMNLSCKYCVLIRGVCKITLTFNTIQFRIELGKVHIYCINNDTALWSPVLSAHALNSIVKSKHDAAV